MAEPGCYYKWTEIQKHQNSDCCAKLYRSFLHWPRLYSSGKKEGGKKENGRKCLVEIISDKSRLSLDKHIFKSLWDTDLRSAANNEGNALEGTAGLRSELDNTKK